MGKVYLNRENKLVVQTDNDIIKPDNTVSTRISNDEKYYIEVPDIYRIMNMINNSNIEIYSGYLSYPLKNGCVSYTILTDEETSKKINELREMKDNEIKALKDKIEEYNSKRKIFWKPIKID